MDELEYVMHEDHAVIRRADPGGQPDEDPALVGLLDLVERDIMQHPERLAPLPRALFDRVQTLTAGIEINPDEPIHGRVAL